MNIPDLLPEEQVKALLYEAIVELEYAQNVENCNSGLCASAKGKEIIKRGMQLLRVKDLSRETLYGEAQGKLLAAIHEL